MNVEKGAATLYEFGYRSKDRESLMSEQNLTADEADLICASLKKLEELPPNMIRFFDSARNLYFVIPDGGLIQMTKPEGETTIRRCKFINHEAVSLDGHAVSIAPFVDLMVRNGISFAPLVQPEMIEGYSITDKTVVGGMVFALAHNPAEAHPYTTWAGRTGPEGYYDWKHSFSDRHQAHADYMKRYRDAQYHSKQFIMHNEHSR